MKSKDQIMLEEAYRVVCEAPVEDVTKTSQRTGQEPNRRLYDLGEIGGTVAGKKNKMNVAMFENPKYVNYLKQNLFLKVPHKFEIILKDSNLKYKQQIELAGNNPETITVIMDNVGDDPLTPWIMGHRIGHLYNWKVKQSSSFNMDNPWRKFLQNHEDIGSIVKELVSNIDPECDVFTTDNTNVEDHEEIFTKLSPFKSARDGQVNGVMEYFTELHAQYLATGRVEFNKDLPHWKEYSDRATEYMKGYYNSLKGMWDAFTPPSLKEI